MYYHDYNVGSWNDEIVSQKYEFVSHNYGIASLTYDSVVSISQWWLSQQLDLILHNYDLVSWSYDFVSHYELWQNYDYI